MLEHISKKDRIMDTVDKKQVKALRREMKATVNAARKCVKLGEDACRSIDSALNNLDTLQKRIRQLKQERGDDWFKTFLSSKTGVGR